MNNQKFAGHDDWRLPTLEEAISLMEPKKSNDSLYIDPIFDGTQQWIWTADKESAGLAAWYVDFDEGTCKSDNVAFIGFVRAVRCGKSIIWSIALLDRFKVAFLKIFYEFCTTKHTVAQMKGLDFIMNQKLKGWFRLAVVTTPIVSVISIFLERLEDYFVLLNFFDFLIPGWVAYPVMYGTANFIFWMLVGVTMNFAVPWVVKGFKNER